MTDKQEQQPELPPKEGQGSTEQAAEQPSGLSERVKLEAAAAAWLRQRDPYAA